MKTTIYLLCLILGMTLESATAFSNPRIDNNSLISVTLITEKDGFVSQKDTTLNYSGELDQAGVKQILYACGITDAMIESGTVIKSITLNADGNLKTFEVEHIQNEVNSSKSPEKAGTAESTGISGTTSHIESEKGGPYRNKFFIKPKQNIEKGYDIAGEAAKDPDKDIIDDIENNSTMKIDALQYYPNPSNGRFNFKFSITEPCKTVITIFNANGQEVYYEVINNYAGDYSRSIDLSANGKGIYFLNIEQGNKTINEKLVIY